MVAGHGYQAGGDDGRGRKPGYPIFLAGVYELFAGSNQAALLVQAVLGGGIVWMTYLLGRRAGEWVGVLAAAAGGGGSFERGLASGRLLSETPFTLMLLVAIWVCVRMVECGGWHRWSVLGLVWVAADYLRAEALWCIVPLGVAVGWMKLGKPWKWQCARGWHGRWGFCSSGWRPGKCGILRIFHSGYFRMTTLEGGFAV